VICIIVSGNRVLRERAIRFFFASSVRLEINGGADVYRDSELISLIEGELFKKSGLFNSTRLDLLYLALEAEQISLNSFSLNSSWQPPP